MRIPIADAGRCVAYSLPNNSEADSSYRIIVLPQTFGQIRTQLTTQEHGVLVIESEHALCASLWALAIALPGIVEINLIG